MIYMAGNIQGITIQFRGETTSLEQAIKRVNSESRGIDAELKKVNNALKFNPTSVDLWRQKQTLLNQKIKDTQDKLKLLKDEQKRLDGAGVDKNSAEYRNLQREIITTESKLKTFKGQLNSIGNVKLKAVSEQFKQIGDKLTSAGQAFAPFSAAGAAVAGSLGLLAVKSASAADDLTTLSKVTGISVQNLQKYKAAADLVDVSVETIAKSQQKLTKSIASAGTGTGKQAEAFNKLGISVKNADGSFKDTDTVFNETVKALGNVKNETERNSLAMTLMGKSAMELNPLIEDGGKTYEAMAKSMAENDLKFVDQETLDGANKFNDALDTLKANGLATLSTVGTQLASYLAPAMEKISGALSKILGWLSKLSPQTLTIIGVIAALVAAIAPVLLFLGKISFAISSITSLMGTLGVSFGAIAVPIGIAVAAIAAAIAIGVLLYKNWDKIKAFAKKLWDNIKTTFNGIKTTITTVFNNVRTFIANVWNAIMLKIRTTIISIKTTVSTVFTAIKTTISTVFNAVKTFISTVWNAIKTTISTVIKGIKNTVSTVFNAIKTTISTVWNGIKTTISTVINSIKTTVSTVFTAIKSKIASIWTGIKTTITTAITGAKTTISTVVSSIKTKITTVFSSVLTSVKSKFSSIKNAITEPIKKAKETVSGAIGKIKDIINGAHLKLPHFKLPHFKINGGKLPWGIGGKGSPPSISVDWYAKGGIFDSASLIGVGEKGPEAVVPLDTLWNKLDKIAEASSGPQIVINVQASPGMDTTALAQEIERKLINSVNRRRLAWS